MLYPSIFGENLFDDFFRFPDFGRDVEKKLYGKHAAQVMKTDVHEHDDHYEIVIDLPGFKKDQINLELQNGYLTVSATVAVCKMQSAVLNVTRIVSAVCPATEKVSLASGDGETGPNGLGTS